ASEENRDGVRGAMRLEPRQVVDQGFVDRFERQLSVGVFDPEKRLGGHAPREELTGVATEFFEAGGGQTSSHRLFMPSELREEMRHLRKDSVKGDTRD